MNKLAAVSPETLPRTTYRNIPVVTSKQLAFLYGTNQTNIRTNIHANKDRFVAGKHYFLLEGNDLRAFKSGVSRTDSVCSPFYIAKNVSSLTLWTERGAARHAKMLDTDQAWEVFERLEDCYFNTPAPPAKKLPAPVPAKVSASGRVRSSKKEVDPVLAELLKRCTNEEIALVYMLFGYIEAGKPFRMDLTFN